jgi:hypothetical protein
VRVDWVHPSWRDLVIQSLVANAEERRRFLSRCGVDGAAVALSTAGGSEGERVRPLLRDDADWDALGDALYHLCPELDEAEATRLLNVLADVHDGPELLALAEMVLKRLGWSGKAVSVDAIGAWVALSARLDPRPDPPAVAMTWLELEPSRPPETPEEIERMADWLRLAELLSERAPELLEGLGFPERYEHVLEAFAHALPREEPPVERELRIESLMRIAALDPALTADAARESLALSLEATDPLPEALPASNGFPVDRVLNDL